MNEENINNQGDQAPEQSVDQSLEQSVNQAPEQPVDQVPEQSVDQSLEQPTKKKTHMWIVPVAIIAAIAVIAIGIFNTKKAQNLPDMIYEAIENTFKPDQFMKDIDNVCKITRDQSATCDIDGTVGLLGYSADFDITIADDIENKLAYIGGNIKYDDIDTDINLYMDDSNIIFTNSILDKAIAYNYTKDINEYTGYLFEDIDKEDLQEVNDSIKEIYDAIFDTKNHTQFIKDVENVIVDDFKDNKFTKIKDKKEFMIDGKKVSCDGYTVRLSGDDINNVLTDIEEVYNKYFPAYTDAIGNISGNWNDSIFGDEYRSQISEIGDIDVRFYIYKKQLASIELEDNIDSYEFIFGGGDMPWHNLQIVHNDENILELKESISNDETILTLTTENDGEIASLTYNPSSKAYSIDLMSIISITGDISYDDNTGSITLKTTGCNLSMTVGKGADIDKPTEDMLDLATATESDIDELQEKYLKLIGMEDLYGSDITTGDDDIQSYDDYEITEEDIELAKQYLKEAGYSDEDIEGFINEYITMQ